MHRSTRRLQLLVAPALVGLAVLGFLAGHRHPPAASAERARLSYGASIVLEYPSSWRPVAAPAEIPGLALAHPVALAPAGNSARAALVSGQLPGGEPGPLPGALLRLMPSLPRTEIVDLLDVQAYRYDRLRLPGYERRLELYVIPNPAAAPTALGCYAAPRYTSYLEECERIVTRLTLMGQSRYDLNPDTRYSRRLGRLIATLDSQRLMLRRRIRLQAMPAALAPLASTLAARFATAAASTRVLQAPAAAGPTQAALVGSLERARVTYRLLAGAARAASGTDLVAARGRVESAEAGVDLALETFALMGYSPS